MKILHLFLLAGLMASAVSARAQNGPPVHAGQGLHAALQNSDDLAALDHFLSMSDAELDQLQLAIARVRAMMPAERASFRQKIIAYRQLPAAEREQVRQGWGWQNEQDRGDWRAMMQAKTEAERNAVQTELQALSPEHRTARKRALLEAWRAGAAPH